MPRLPDDLGDRLVAALAAEPRALAALARAGAELHPVCAAWRVSALERLPTYLASGKRSLRGFAALCNAATADWPDDMAACFANANTPGELASLREPGRRGRLAD
jgi:molybdopterin-guanine dinucleotide biosynthesis protein A